MSIVGAGKQDGGEFASFRIDITKKCEDIAKIAVSSLACPTNNPVPVDRVLVDQVSASVVTPDQLTFASVVRDSSSSYQLRSKQHRVTGGQNRNLRDTDRPCDHVTCSE